MNGYLREVSREEIEEAAENIREFTTINQRWPISGCHYAECTDNTL